jgi:hypothetical protein
MSLTDEEVSAVIAAADISPMILAIVVSASGIDATGDAVADIRKLAEEWGFEVEDVLYGLFEFEDSPMLAGAFDEPLTKG